MQQLEAGSLQHSKTDAAIYPSQPPATPRTLVDVLETTASTHSQAIAVDNGTARLSYAELLSEVGARAEQLQAAGVGTGDRVGIRMSSGSIDLYLGILAILSAGAAYVPVDVDDPDDRAELVWSEAQVCAVLSDGFTLTRHKEPIGAPSRPCLEDDAWIIFTSGSTGKPKGVAVTHRSAAAFVDAEAGLFLPNKPIGPGDRVLAGLSVAFDASCEEMWLAWRHGACLVPAPRSLVKSGADLGTFLSTQRISVVSTVPTLATLWPAEALRDIRLLILGGEACSAELAARLARDDREVWNTYGPTEATVVSCAALLHPGKPVRIGLPLTGWELAVVGPDDRPVSWGETGELVIGGAGLARYLDKVKDTAKFAALPSLSWDRAYRSGDVVRADAEGLVFVGRQDDQVKLGGRRVELGEIDAALMTLPAVSAAACAIRRSETGREVLVGYLVRDEKPNSADRELLRRRLPEALIPMLVLVESLPIRTSGKVDRAALPWPLPSTDSQPDLEGTAGWLAEQWRRVLGVPVPLEANFFDLGGTSLAVAQLVSLLRKRCPSLSVVDIYQHPTLTDQAARVDSLSGTSHVIREVKLVPRYVGFIQFTVILFLCALQGLRWIMAVAALSSLAKMVLGSVSWTVPIHWWLSFPIALVYVALPGRVITTAIAVRLLTLGITPGKYRRAGFTHLRLWTAERLVASSTIVSIVGTQWCRRYARLLGCHVGANAQLHTMPPVTGLATFGAECAVEPEADVAGWWLDGDMLHVGSITIGMGARVGTRSMLMPNTVLEPYAEVSPGVCVSGTIVALGTLPTSGKTEGGCAPYLYTLTLLLVDALPALAAWPAVYFPFLLINDFHNARQVFVAVMAMAVPGAVAGVLCYAALVVVLVRFASRFLLPGSHSWNSVAAWAAWLTKYLMNDARNTLFIIYSSLLTPTWLRLLGAKVGRRVEASNIITPPSLLEVDDGAFLADDVLLSPYQLWTGRINLGPASVGRRAFVGNSGIVEPGHVVPDQSLIGVLATTPAHDKVLPGSSWLGRPAMSLPRRAESVDPSLTFNPPRRLVVARALIECGRILPMVFFSILTQLYVYGMLFMNDKLGFGWTIFASGGMLFTAGVTACALASAFKWLLMTKIKVGQHPLWSSYVWRKELFDTFVESLAVPWFARICYGTPLLSIWLRSLGAKIGRGVWCETHLLPEADLVRFGPGATINRGSVLQTHLFHDRLMRIDAVKLEAGVTLGPYAIVLPGSVVGAGTTIGPLSLIMRGEHIPEGTRWLGNPVRPWKCEEEEEKRSTECSE